MLVLKVGCCSVGDVVDVVVIIVSCGSTSFMFCCAR